MNINRADGYIKLHRSVMDSDLAEDNNSYYVFIRMVGMAHHEDGFSSIRFGGKQVKLMRGEFSASLAELSDVFHLPKSTVRNVIERLKSESRIGTRTDKQKTIYSICNYAKYQDVPAQSKAHERHTTGTREAHVTDTKRNKEIKNIDTKVSNSMAIKKSPRADIDELFAYWEMTTGIPISSNQQKNRYAVSNLLKKHGIEAVKRYIDGVNFAQQTAYAPKISSFVALQSRLDDLLVWGKGVKQSNSKKVVSV